jgi:hypothetical protein
MRRKSTCQSGLLNLGTLTVLLLCAVAACFIVIPTRAGLTFFQRPAPSKSMQRTLTFEERVSYQRAIEEVYWRHRMAPRPRGAPRA